MAGAMSAIRPLWNLIAAFLAFSALSERALTMSEEVYGPPDECIDIEQRLRQIDRESAIKERATGRYFEVIKGFVGKNLYYAPIIKREEADSDSVSFLFTDYPKCPRGCAAFVVYLDTNTVLIYREVKLFRHIVYAFPFNNSLIGNASAAVLSPAVQDFIYFSLFEANEGKEYRIRVDQEPINRATGKDTFRVKAYQDCLRAGAKGGDFAIYP